jgi:Na+-transporting NADH:ubiquinone oxidoreductase subunit B
MISADRASRLSAMRTALKDSLQRTITSPLPDLGGPPHARSGVTTDRVLKWFVIASFPALVVGAWSVGDALAAALDSAGVGALGWRGWLLAADAVPGWLGSTLVGLSFWAPLFAVSFAVALAWEVAFAVGRRRSVDPGALMSAWLFAALLPPTMPLPVAAIGLSFGVVLGCHVFGGTGRYLVSPALLGVVYLTIAHSELFAPGAWLPAADSPSTWSDLASRGVAGLTGSGVSWADVLLGREIGAIATPSALLSFAGAAFLVARGAASRRTLLGGLVGLIVASYLLGASEDPVSEVPWYWHVTTGYFAFGLAFVATDPTTTPLTAMGRWLHGATIGVLVVVMRVANPEHPEGTLPALLLASLFAPVFDHVVIRIRARSSTRSLIA